MAWINVRADTKLIDRIMEKHGFSTRREAVDYALSMSALGYYPKHILELRGTGWEGDLGKMRRTRNLEW